MKTNKDLIIEPNAAIEGRKYSEEKPWSCKYCYWRGGKKKGCNLKQCHYLLPEKKKDGGPRLFAAPARRNFLPGNEL